MSPRSKAVSSQMKAASMAAILDAAEKVFGEEGFHSATTATIATRAGVSKGLVFNYFATKDDLLAAIVNRRLKEQLTFWRDLDLTGTPVARLRQIVDRGLDSVIAHPDAHRLYFSLLLQPGASKPVQAAVDELKPALAEYYSLIEGLFKARGSAAPRAEAFAFQAALSGLAFMLTIQPEISK